MKTYQQIDEGWGTVFPLRREANVEYLQYTRYVQQIYFDLLIRVEKDPFQKDIQTKETILVLIAIEYYSI